MDLSSRGKQINIQGTWRPVTPSKPISKPIPTRPYANQAAGRSDWMDSMGGFFQGNTANGYLNSTSSVDQRVELNSSWEEALAGKNRATPYQDLNQWNNVSFQQLMNLVNSSGQHKEVKAPTSVPYFPFSLPEPEFNSGNMFLEQNYPLGLNQRNSGKPHYGFPVPYTSASMYDLNSAPMTIADVVSNGRISFERPPQTPDKGNSRMNNQIPDAFHQSTSGRMPSFNEMAIHEMQFEPVANMATLSQFAPLTPDKGMHHIQASEIVSNVQDERIPEKSKFQEDVPQKESNNFELQSLQESCLESVVNPSPAALENPTQKTAEQQLEKGDENGIDLNKTPSQKPPRRKKHRPKVVAEFKPKRTPKQTPKSNMKPNSERVKRKYVRKKGVNASETPSEDVARDGNEANKRNVRPRSCKRSLNFDLEGEAHGSQENGHQEKDTIYGNPEKGHQEQEKMPHTIYGSPEKGRQEQEKMPNSVYGQCSRNQDSSGTTTLLFSRGLERIEGSSRANIALDLNCAAGQQIVDYINLPEITNQVPTRRELLRKNLDFLVARDEPCNANNAEKNSVLLHGISSQVSRNQNLNPAAENKQEGVSMRAHLQSVDEGVLSSNEGMLFPEIYKKRRTTTSKLPCAESPPQGNTSQHSNGICIESLRNRSSARVDEICSPFVPSGHPSCMQNIPGKPFSRAEAVNELMLSIRQTEMKTGKRSKGQTRVRDVATLSTVTQCNNQQSPLPKIAPASQDRGILQVYQRLQYSLPSLSAQKYSRKRSKRSTASSPNINNMRHQDNQAATSGYDHYLANTRGRKEVAQKSPVDDLVRRLDCLNISGKSKMISGEEQRALVPFSISGDREMVSRNEQSALVPFKGDDRMVPYAGIFDATKKRKPRGKVYIDPATESEWKLIMYNIIPSEAEGAGGLEFWKSEREIMSGRAHAFIAHMHLLQGDRTFTPWRGSVLDSVIGVFLTQNVSDHLSSSAFMAMVANFPPKIKSDDRTCREEELKMYVEEPEVENIKWHESIPPPEPVRSQDTQSSVIIQVEDKETGNISESFESNTGGYCSSGISDKEVGTCEEPPESKADKRILEVESCGVSPQTSAGITSCSDSNSEEEDPKRLKPNDLNNSTTGFMELLRANMYFRDYYNSGNEFLPLDLNFDQCHNQSEPSTSEKISNPDRIYAESSSKSNHMEAPVTQSSNCCLQGCSETGIQTLSSQAASVGAPNSFLNRQSGNSFINLEQEASPGKQPVGWEYIQPEINTTGRLERIQSTESEILNPLAQNRETSIQQAGSNSPNFSGETLDVVESTTLCEKKSSTETTDAESRIKTQARASISSHERAPKTLKPVAKLAKEKNKTFDWDSLRKEAYQKCGKREQNDDTMDSLDWEAVRNSDVNTIAHAIKERGMNNMLAERIKDFLNRLVRDHGSLDLEWLRDVPPEKAKEYLLSVRGLGLKSVECVRLLTLHHVAFPVDTNVGRIAVRLGWVPLQPLPESLQLDLLELYPVQETIQKYLWPRLCTLDQRTLYELHYQMITFGKVFCTKSKPNCNACPMRADCRHFASAFAREKLLLPGPSEKGIVTTTVPAMDSQVQSQTPVVGITTMSLPPPEANQLSTMSLPPPGVNNLSETRAPANNSEPIIEVPASPEPECNEILESDIEDAFLEDPDEIPTIKLNIESFQQNLQNYMQENNMELQDGGLSQALVALNPEAASIPTPKLKNVNRLRTEHQVYELPDSHPLLIGVEKRFPGDVSSYLLAIWTPGETADTVEPPGRCCNSQTSGGLCSETTCFSCNSMRESNSQTVRGTLLIPCKTAMRGSFPLNGTYFQVNEVFADHESSISPIDVPRAWLWNLRKRTVYFGTSIPSIFKGQTTEQIQSCFWKGYVCVRGFDRKTRAPRPLKARLHFPASRLAAKTKG